MAALARYVRRHAASLRRLAMVVWLGSIAVDIHASLMPDLKLPGAAWNSDKFCHFATYAWLGGLALVAVPGRRAGRLAAVAMIVLGAALEWGQSFVPPRTASVGDALANAAGVLLGVWLVERWLRDLARPAVSQADADPS